jgi:hypothetical protein
MMYVLLMVRGDGLCYALLCFVLFCLDGQSWKQLVVMGVIGGLLLVLVVVGSTHSRTVKDTGGTFGTGGTVGSTKGTTTSTMLANTHPSKDAHPAKDEKQNAHDHLPNIKKEVSDKISDALSTHQPPPLDDQYHKVATKIKDEVIPALDEFRHRNGDVVNGEVLKHSTHEHLHLPPSSSSSTVPSTTAASAAAAVAKDAVVKTVKSAASSVAHTAEEAATSVAKTVSNAASDIAHTVDDAVRNSTHAS